MTQIWVLNQSGADDADMAFACRAVDAQVRHDFCTLFTSVPYQPVAFFAGKQNLPTFEGVSLLDQRLSARSRPRRCKGSVTWLGFIAPSRGGPDTTARHCAEAERSEGRSKNACWKSSRCFTTSAACHCDLRECRESVRSGIEKNGKSSRNVWFGNAFGWFRREP
jgi:hypothetical protein